MPSRTMPGCRSSSFSTPSRKLAVLKAGRGSRPGLFEFRQNVGDSGHPEDGIRKSLWLELAEYRCITDQRLQFALCCRKNAPHDGVGFRMDARRIERIVAVADAQKSC